MKLGLNLDESPGLESFPSKYKPPLSTKNSMMGKIKQDMGENLDSTFRSIQSRFKTLNNEIKKGDAGIET
jgi:hypothetical protein